MKDRPRFDRINGFARAGSTVFGANKEGYISAVELIDRGTIREFAARNVEDDHGLRSPHDVALMGDLLVVAFGNGFGRKGQPGGVGLYRVLDKPDGRALAADRWEKIGALVDPLLAGCNRLAVRGGFVVTASSLSPQANAADKRGNVARIDLSEPAKPRLGGSVIFPDSRGPNGLGITGEVAFAAGGQTVMAIDLSDPKVFRELGHVTLPDMFSGGADDAHDLVYHAGHLFVTAQNTHALVILRVDNTEIRKLAEAE